LAAIAAREGPGASDPGAILRARPVVDADPAVEIDLREHLFVSDDGLLGGVSPAPRAADERPRDGRERRDRGVFVPDAEQPPHDADGVVAVADRNAGLTDVAEH